MGMVGISSGRIGTHARRAQAQAPGTAQVRVLLGAPQRMMRQALTAALGAHHRLRMVGDVGNGKDALRWALEVRPDITLLDQGLGTVDGVHAAFAIHSEDPALKLAVYRTRDLGGPGHRSFMRRLQQRLHSHA